MASRDNDDLEDDPTPINRKILVPSTGGRYQVYMDAKRLPFYKLRKDALLDTSDLCKLFGCSMRTIYRWVEEQDLRPKHYEGRVYLFTKREILDWWEDNRPQRGRPPGSGGRR
jgi:excisionase family DNA binding protein